MFNVGPEKLLVVLVVVLLVFGPEKLPEVGRQIGRAMREFRKFQDFMNQNVRDAIEPIIGPLNPNSPIPPAETTVRSDIPESPVVQPDAAETAPHPYQPEDVRHNGTAQQPTPAPHDSSLPSAGEASPPAWEHDGPPVPDPG
jgi:TatA/E family protein of Tat protein translocase